MSIGSVVRLVTKEEIIYDGIIHYINIEDSMLCLKKAICSGKIDEVHDHKIFTGNEIKDLKVISLPKQLSDLNGNFVSVLTKEDVRVEGVMSHFNLDDSAFIIQNAYCYGTEERKKKRKSKIRGCEKVIDPIVFEFRDLKDFEVIFLQQPLLGAEDSTGFPPLSRTHISHRTGDKACNKVQGKS